MAKRKRSWGSWVLQIVLSIIAVFIIACFAVDQLVQFRMSDKELQVFFKQNKLDGRIHYYQAGGRTLRYIEIGNDTLPPLLFIHGSPASLSIYNRYYKDTLLQRRFKMYAVDRPGYGYSGLGKVEPSLQKQAAMIQPLLQKINNTTKPVLLVSGSYGTSVACRLAMDYSNLVDGLVLIAPSLAPGQEYTYWFTPAIEHPALNWFIPRMFQSANTEKLAHKKELTQMLPYWKNIQVPVTYVQGANDKLIDTSNATFARQHLAHVPYLSVQLLPGQPHFIPFTAHSLIRQKILKVYTIADSLQKDAQNSMGFQKSLVSQK